MFGESNGKTKGKPLSRVGRKPIPVPPEVQISLDYSQVTVKGPKGTLIQKLHPEVKVILEDSIVLVERLSSKKFHRAVHGLTRSLIANAIVGVTDGYTRSLDLMGVGYRAQQNGTNVVLNVGYSHSVEIKSVEGVSITVEGNNKIHVQGCSKEHVGGVAARIRKVRPPNAYKAKGIKYSDEVLRLKPGKTAARKA